LKNLTDVRDRFLRDPLPRRIGNIAANLARIETFSDRSEHQAAISGLLLESKYFIEWSAPQVPPDLLGDLVDLQRTLVVWERSLPRTLASPQARRSMAAQAKEWSLRLLEKSGLIGSSRMGSRT
jgi:hypothetical protein